MARWDPESGKVRATWMIRFSPWWILVGCAIAGLVCALVLFITLVTGPGFEALNDSASVVRGGILLVGITVAIFVVIGPTLAWGVGFVLRNNPNHNIHIIAFAATGMMFGLLLGGFVEGLGSVLAPAAGVGAAAGRWAISKQATTSED